MSQFQVELAADMSDLLKAAMRRMASSVSIISAAGPDGGRAAMTATSVTSLSLDPPSMLVCVNRNAWLYQTLRLGGDFCINVLGADQIAMAQSCGGKSQGDARFAQGWRDEMGVPVLIGAPSAIVCGQVTRLALGTHDVIVGHVKRVLVDDAQVDPLLYVNGAYARVGEALYGGEFREVR